MIHQPTKQENRGGSQFTPEATTLDDVMGIKRLLVAFVSLFSALVMTCTVGPNAAEQSENPLETAGDAEEEGDPLDDEADDDGVYDVDAMGIPQFIAVNYIDLDGISRISRFRSGIGHDYSDSFESCRSMKHYFEPADAIDWASVAVFSPVSGAVVRVDEEWAGTQLHIVPDGFPAFFVIIFHIDLSDPVSLGDTVTAGQQLGTHIGSQTMSDIAIGASTPDGWKLLSYFDVLTDSVFEEYRLRGLDSRSEAVVSKDARDADPLTCVGGAFADEGQLENWLTLN